jgi:ATP-dependent DNA ligase
MLLLRREKLLEGPDWRYELKHDGYRAIAFKSNGKLYLRSRNNKDFADRYPSLLKGPEGLPDDTVIDGEVVVVSSPTSNVTLAPFGISGVTVTRTCPSMVSTSTDNN